MAAGPHRAPVAVLGDGRPDGAATVEAPRLAQAPDDLLVLAPDRRQAADRAWMAAASEAVARHTAAGGAAYALTPPLARLRLRRRLRRRQVEGAWAVLHRRHGGVLTLVPLARGPLHFAAAQMARGPRRRRLARLVARAPGAPRGLALLMPSVGLLLRRRAGPAPPEGAWPGTPWRPGVDPPPLVSSDGRTAVLRLFLRGASAPAWLVKVPLGAAEAARRRREAVAASRVAPGARAAGARVSVPRLVEAAGGWPAAVQEALPGIPASDALWAHPRTLPGVLDRVAGWIVRWNAATATPGELTGALLREHLLEPAEALAGLLPDGRAYRRALAALCREWEGRAVPLVAAHNDLTMGNVLLEPGGGLGVIDWESAAERALPLTDLLYACADAHAAADAYRDRPRAWRRAFVDPGPLRARVVAAEAAAIRATGMDPALHEICVQACWLGHARNERAADDGRTAFLAIARQAARRLTAGGVR